MLRVCSVTPYNQQTKSVTKKNGKSQQEHILNSVKLNSEVSTENRKAEICGMRTGHIGLRLRKGRSSLWTENRTQQFVD